VTSEGGSSAQAGGANGTSVALRFLAAIRQDPTLRESVAEVVSDGGLDAVVDVAAEAGFPVDVDDLRDAFKIDWGMRRARYLRD
jgi:Nif11 domain